MFVNFEIIGYFADVGIGMEASALLAEVDRSIEALLQNEVYVPKRLGSLYTKFRQIWKLAEARAPISLKKLKKLRGKFATRCDSILDKFEVPNCIFVGQFVDTSLNLATDLEVETHVSVMRALLVARQILVEAELVEKNGNAQSPLLLTYQRSKVALDEAITKQKWCKFVYADSSTIGAQHSTENDKLLEPLMSLKGEFFALPYIDLLLKEAVRGATLIYSAARERFINRHFWLVFITASQASGLSRDESQRLLAAQVEFLEGKISKALSTTDPITPQPQLLWEKMNTILVTRAQRGTYYLDFSFCYIPFTTMQNSTVAAEKRAVVSIWLYRLNLFKAVWEKRLDVIRSEVYEPEFQQRDQKNLEKLFKARKLAQCGKDLASLHQSAAEAFDVFKEIVRNEPDDRIVSTLRMALSNAVCALFVLHPGSELRWVPLALEAVEDIVKSTPADEAEKDRALSRIITAKLRYAFLGAVWPVCKLAGPSKDVLVSDDWMQTPIHATQLALIRDDLLDFIQSKLKLTYGNFDRTLRDISECAREELPKSQPTRL